MPDARQFDYIIVGGGSAGCVLASRLSEDPTAHVLLVEAGRDFLPGETPDALRDRGARSLMMRQFFWAGMAVNDGPRAAPILLGKLVGGGSAINGMHAQRGVADDYDSWRQLGIEGWSWSDLLPYFRRVETDVDFGGSDHGKEGPLEIRRVPEKDWSALSHAVRDVFDRSGVPRLQDVNSETGDGTSGVPLNNSESQRISAADAYLSPAVRARSNLSILANTYVRKVLFEGRTVTGIELEDGRHMNGSNVVLSAGALQSPALLLRSGIGAAETVRSSGIDVVADLPAVGKNLGAHPSFTVTAHLRRRGRQRRQDVRPPAPMVARYSSGAAGCEPTDMMVNLWERSPGPLERDPLSRQLCWLMILINKSYSRGEIHLNPNDPFGLPQIRAQLLSDPRDLDRMVNALRFAGKLLADPGVSRLVNYSFIANIAQGIKPDFFTGKLLQDTRTARLISLLGAAGFDFVPGVRSAVLGSAGRSLDAVLAMNDADLEAFIRRICSFGGHPVGTCSMGDPANAGTVIDSRCRVVGIDGLRVADASIFPEPMRAGTNLPVIAAAEKIAEMIIEDRRTIKKARTEAA